MQPGYIALYVSIDFIYIHINTFKKNDSRIYVIYIITVDNFVKVNSADYCDEQSGNHSACKCSSTETEACTAPGYCFFGKCIGKYPHNDLYNCEKENSHTTCELYLDIGS